MGLGNNSPRNNDLPGQLIAGLDGAVYRPIAVNAAGEIITAGGGGVTASDIQQWGSVAVGAAAVPSDAFAGVEAPFVFAAGALWNGATFDRWRGNTSGGFVQGPVAHDAAVGGNPVLIGARAQSTTPAAVANGDIARLWSTLSGALVTAPGIALTAIDGFGNNAFFSFQTPTGGAGPVLAGGLVFDDVGGVWNRTRGNVIAQFAQGGIAIDSPISTMFPVFMGGRAENDRPTEVSADNDVQAIWLNRAGAVRITPEVSATADILTGIVSHTATTAATTIITIPGNLLPPGRTWKGSITISVDVAVAAASAVAGQALGEVSISAGGSSPAPGTYWRCEARCGANAATGTAGSQAANSITIPDVEIINTSGGNITLQLTSTITGTNGRVDAMATGKLID